MFVQLLFWMILCFCLLKTNTKRPPVAVGAWPFVGHTFQVIRRPEALYKLLLNLSMDCVRKGGAITLRIVTTYVYGIADPEDAKLVLNSCLQKDITYDYFKPWIGEGLVTASEPQKLTNSEVQENLLTLQSNVSISEVVWQRHRKLLNPTFNQVVLDSYIPEFNKHSRTLIQNLEAYVGKGMFYHVPAIEDIALQAICSTAMGVATDDEDKMMREDYKIAKSKFNLGLVERAKKFWLQSEFVYKYFSSLGKRQEERARSLHALTNSIIKKRKAEMDLKRADTEHRFKPFLELLLEMAKDGAFTDTEVQEEVDTFMFTGSDSVTVGLTIVLLAIASSPEVQRNIVEELQDVFKGSERDVEKQDLVQLKYLEAVIKETMRLYPIVPLVARTLVKNVKIKNFILPAGGRCFVTVYGVNRHPVWGPDAEEFRPERWLDAASLPRHHAFASFGLGRRRCIGNNYAIIFMKTTLAHVLRRYKVSGDITQLEQTMEVVGRPVAKDYISIERRNTTLLNIP